MVADEQTRRFTLVHTVRVELSGGPDSGNGRLQGDRLESNHGSLQEDLLTVKTFFFG